MRNTPRPPSCCCHFPGIRRRTPCTSIPQAPLTLPTSNNSHPAPMITLPTPSLVEASNTKLINRRLSTDRAAYHDRGSTLPAPALPSPCAVDQSILPRTWPQIVYSPPSIRKVEGSISIGPSFLYVVSPQAPKLQRKLYMSFHMLYLCTYEEGGVASGGHPAALDSWNNWFRVSGRNAERATYKPLLTG